MSVAKVALAHGINTNILHGWRKLTHRAEPAVVRQEFVPVAVAATAPARCDDRAIELELRRGTMAIKLLWPPRPPWCGPLRAGSTPSALP